MTFTKGIGTPKYMAPEILKRQHYKMPSDIYSLAVTMLEIMTWNDAFPRELFRFPWKIAEFISEGKRPNTIDNIQHQSIKHLISQMWNQNPKDRLSISSVVKELEQIQNKK